MSLSVEDFELVRLLALQRAAIVLEAGEEYLVESKLTKLARDEGYSDAAGLADALRRAQSRGSIADRVVEAMTTDETRFFRDARPFDAMRLTILPELIEARARERSLTVWSLACSTGQEPYSLAILLREHFPTLISWRLKIIAGDLSTEVLDRARSGVYTQLEVNRGLPAPLLLKYFDREGTTFRAKPELRSMIEFRPLNLADRISLIPRADVVFLRNVMIYFDVTTRERILGQVASQMAADGYLLLGAGETTLDLDVPFERTDLEGTDCFRPTGSARVTTPKEQSWNRPATMLVR